MKQYNNLLTDLRRISRMVVSEEVAKDYAIRFLIDLNSSSSDAMS